MERKLEKRAWTFFFQVIEPIVAEKKIQEKKRRGFPGIFPFGHSKFIFNSKGY